MFNLFSKNYIQKAIKDQIRVRKISAINVFIRELVPKYELTDDLRDKISKLLGEQK